MRTTLFRSLVVPSALALVLAAGLGVRGAFGADAPAPPARPAPPPPGPAPQPSPAAGLEDSLALGSRYFDQAIAWVARGGTLGHAVDLYAHFQAKWDLDDNTDEGIQSVWFLSPDKMRSEMTLLGGTTTKVLAGDRAWVLTRTGVVNRIHGTPEGADVLKQMKEDLVRVQDLTAFVTLEGLRGPGIVFEFQGVVKGSGIYEGDWLKIARRSPDGRKIVFWFGYERGPDGAIHATWPGVVRIEGDAAQGLWTEDWIFSEWDSPRPRMRPFRYPLRIQGWRSHPDPKMAASNPPKRFLFAAVDDLDINSGIDPAKFEQPVAATPR